MVRIIVWKKYGIEPLFKATYSSMAVAAPIIEFYKSYNYNVDVL
jgi:hypothetical protein